MAYRYTGKPDGELYTKAGASHRIPQGGPYRVRITLAGTEFTRVHKFTVENSSKFFVMKKA